MFAHVGPIDSAVILTYFAILVCMGVFLSRKQNSTEEYFLGRRSMHWLVVGISIQASVMSTISWMMWRGVRNWPLSPEVAILPSMYS